MALAWVLFDALYGGIRGVYSTEDKAYAACEATNARRVRDGFCEFIHAQRYEVDAHMRADEWLDGTAMSGPE